MPPVFEIILPVFGIIAVAYLAARIGVFSDTATDGLARYVFDFATPALLFRGMATQGLPTPLPWAFLVSYYAAALAVGAIGIAIGRRGLRQAGPDAAVTGFGSAYSNATMLGMPIVFAAFGSEAQGPFFLLLALHAPVLITVGGAALELMRRRPGGAKTAIVDAGTGLLRNPIVMSVVLGTAWGAGGIALPGVLDSVLEPIARTAIPCALFALGATLTRYHLAGSLPAAATMTLLKVVLHPVLVWLLATRVFAVEPLWVRVAVLIAAMPTGINTFLFARQYDAAVPAASSAIILSTLASAVTITALLAWGF
jgi:predicted permease